MILVPIHKASKSPSVDDDDDEDDTPQEWSLLELNGEIQTPRQQQIVDDDAMELGSIEYDHEGTPTIIIASHELKGTVQPLKQPFVVMKKTKKRKITTTSSSAANELVASSSSDHNVDNMNHEYPNRKRLNKRHHKEEDNDMVTRTDDDVMDVECWGRHQDVGVVAVDGGKEEALVQVHSERSHYSVGGEGYEIAGVVTSKILFDRYPKSIMK